MNLKYKHFKQRKVPKTQNLTCKLINVINKCIPPGYCSLHIVTHKFWQFWVFPSKSPSAFHLSNTARRRVEVLPKTVSALPEEGSFLPMAWLIRVLGSKARVSSKTPIQTTPEVPSVDHEADPLAMTWKIYTVSLHRLRRYLTDLQLMIYRFLSFPCFFSFSFLWALIWWDKGQTINQQSWWDLAQSSSHVASHLRRPPWAAHSSDD